MQQRQQGPRRKRLLRRAYERSGFARSPGSLACRRGSRRRIRSS